MKLFFYLSFFVTINNLEVNCFDYLSSQFIAVIFSGSCDNICSGVFLSDSLVLTTSKCAKSPEPELRVYINLDSYLPDCNWKDNLNPVKEKMFPLKDEETEIDHNDELDRLILLQLHEGVTIVDTVILPDHLDSEDETIEREFILYFLGSNGRATFNHVEYDDCPDDLVCGTLTLPADEVNLERPGKNRYCAVVPGLPLISWSRDANGVLESVLAALITGTNCTFNSMGKFIPFVDYYEWLNEKVIQLTKDEAYEEFSLPFNHSPAIGGPTGPNHHQIITGNGQDYHGNYKPNSYSTDEQNVPVIHLDAESMMKFVPNCISDSFVEDKNHLQDGNCICQVQERQLNITLDPQAVLSMKNHMTYTRNDIKIDIHNNNNNKKGGKGAINTG